MEIKKDTILLVHNGRKGIFKAKAIRDFDTEKETFYPVATLERVQGMATTWEIGEEIPCRKDWTEIQVISQPK